MPLTHAEQQRLATSVGKTWQQEYATPGDIVMEEMRGIMKERFEKDLSHDCQDVLRALKLIEEAGVLPSTGLLKEVLPRIFDKVPNIMDCLRILADQSFVDARALPAKIYPEPYYLANVVPYERGDPETNFPLLMNSLEAISDADGLFALGRTFFDNEDKTNARACVEKVAALRSDFAEVLWKEAAAAYENGRYQAAVEMYDYLLLLQPDYANAWANLGVCLDDLGRHEEALAACQRTMDLQPSDPKLWRRIARTAEACRDLVMAEKANLQAWKLEREKK